VAKKKSTQAVRAGNPPLPFWVWLTAGFALGVLVSGVFIFRDWRSERATGTAVRPTHDAQPKPVDDLGIAPNDAPPKTQFDFYTVLKEREVVIPDEELRAQVAQPQVTIEPNTRYWLQVGSFPKPEDAEGMKAQLALMGVKVQIAPVNIDGTTWHRVRTGPYADARVLEEAKRGLQSNNVEAFAYKEKVQ
jgi:cell division protein FtsN